jgi:hypothetical protein
MAAAGPKRRSMEPQEMQKMLSKDTLLAALIDSNELFTHLSGLINVLRSQLTDEDMLLNLKSVLETCKVLKHPALLKHQSDHVRVTVALCLTALLSRIQFTAVVDMKNTTEADAVFHCFVEVISLVGKPSKSTGLAALVLYEIAARKLMLPWLSSSKHMTLLLDTISSLLKCRVEKFSALNLFQIMRDCFDSTLMESQESNIAHLVSQLGWVRAGPDDEADDSLEEIAREKNAGGKDADDDDVAERFQKLRG